MALELWVMVIIFIVGISIILKLVKATFKAAGLIILLFFLLNLTFTFMMVKDVRDLRENFFTEPSLYIFEDNEQVTAAVSFAFPKNGGEPDFELATAQELETYTQLLKEEDLDSLKGEKYRLFITNREFAEALIPSQIEIGDAVLSREESIEMLTTEDSFGYYIQKSGSSQSDGQRILNQMDIDSEDQYRSLFFMVSVISGMFGKGTESMLNSMEQYKKKNLIVHPNTMFFKSFRVVPVTFFKKMMQRATEKAGDALDSTKERLRESLS